jgi:alpha-L-fucosidase 2
MEAAK